MLQRFVDKAKIYVKAGNGGAGCESFYRYARKRHAKPDGGDGGKGGDIIIEADRKVPTLSRVFVKRHFKAGNGAFGSGAKKRGQGGENCVISVPPGTVVREKAARPLNYDLKTPGEQVVVARGGKPGRGNKIGFSCLAGRSGESKELILEFKLIADIGIIGAPNAGKSSLLACLSETKPKIAAFPFTTKIPVLGVIEREDFEQTVIVEIPALVQGSHKGKGVGNAYLKHLERTRLLIHIVDISLPEAITTYHALEKELFIYDEKFGLKKKIIALNKIDLPGVPANARSFKAPVDKGDTHLISCKTKEGIKALRDKLMEILVA